MKPSQDTTAGGVSTALSKVAQWAHALRQLHGRLAPRFARAEPRRRMLSYLQGLLSGVERKNGWQLAEHAREVTPYGMQRLLSSAVWDVDLVRDDLRAYVLEQLGTDDAVVVIDETSFPKRGCKSAGVQMQYCGTSGRVENCQVGVFLAYITAKGHTLIDRELYLPFDWTADARRRQEADIPESVRFQTKPELAVQMMERLRQAQLPISWVVADTVYGGNLDLRTWLEAHGYAYVLAAACDEPVGIVTADGERRRVEVREVEALLLEEQDWQRLAMSEGTKGPRLCCLWRLCPSYIAGKMMDTIGCSFVAASATHERRRTTSSLPQREPPCKRWSRLSELAGILKKTLKRPKTLDSTTTRYAVGPVGIVISRCACWRMLS